MTIFLATLAGLLNRKQHDVIMYLNAENEILKEQLDKKGVKLRLSNAQMYKSNSTFQAPPETTNIEFLRLRRRQERL